MIANGYGASFWGEENVLVLGSGEVCISLWIYYNY